MRRLVISGALVVATLILGVIVLFCAPKEQESPTSERMVGTESTGQERQREEGQKQEAGRVGEIDIQEPELTDIEKRMDKIGLLKSLRPEVFEYALFGLEYFDPVRKDVITIVDFSKPSVEKRLFAIDLINDTLLIKSYVSHGEGSGEKYAIKFSNTHGSHQSTLGFYVTEKSYRGGNGYSMVVDGIEWGINEQVQWRGIVVHGADYADPVIIDSLGYLGMSEGCLALPFSLSTQYIDAVKDGSLILVYANDQQYFSKSKVIRGFQEKSGRTL